MANGNQLQPGSPFDRERYEEEKRLGIRAPNGAARLRKLTGKHLRVVNFHMQGLKAYEIADIMRVSGAWISTVLNDPLAKAVIEQRFVDVDNEHFAKSIKVVGEKLDADDPAIQLRAADMIWRARGRYDKKGDDRPTAEDIVQKMLAMAKDTGEASVTISANVGQRETPVTHDPLLTLDAAE